MSVSEEQLLAALRSLEPTRWADVLDFIAYLRWQDQTEASHFINKRVMTARDLLQSDLVGLWSDRQDIDDNLDFAHRLRHAADSFGRGSEW